MRKSTEADGKYSPRALAGPVPGSPKPSRSRSRVPKCGSSNQIMISIAPFLEDAAPNSFHRRLRNSVNGDHRNASFVGGTDKRCSRVLRRNFPMNCMSARANRYKVLFSVVDRPTNCQHLGSLEKSCDNLVFFRPTHNEHQRGKLCGCAPLHDIRSPHSKHISNCARTVPCSSLACRSSFWRPHNGKENIS